MVEYGIETIMVVVNLCVMFLIVTELFALDRHHVAFSCSLNVYWLRAIFYVFLFNFFRLYARGSTKFFESGG